MGLVMIPAMIEVSDGGAETPEISPDGSGRSLQFGAPASEALSDSVGGPCKHFRNNFSVMWWSKHPAAAAAKTFVLAEQTSGGEGRFHASSTSGVSARIRIRNPGLSSPEVKDYTYPIGTAAQWKQYVIVVDIGADNPTNEQVVIYVDGAKVTPTVKTIDNTLTNRDGVNMTSFLQWGISLSNQHSVAIWDKILKAGEVLAIYNNGVGNVNLSKRKGQYKSQKRLQHWFFFDTTNINNVNRDYGKARTTETIHLLDNADNISEADLVIDAPGY